MLMKTSLSPHTVLMSLAPGIDRDLYSAYFRPGALTPPAFLLNTQSTNGVSRGVTLSLQVSFAGLESTYVKWLFAK